MDNVYLIKAKENRTIIVASSIEDALNLYNDEDNGLDYSPEPTEPIRELTEEEFKRIFIEAESGEETDEDGVTLYDYLAIPSTESPRIVTSTLYAD